jgi:hypothetical protein
MSDEDAGRPRESETTQEGLKGHTDTRFPHADCCPLCGTRRTALRDSDPAEQHREEKP